MEQIFNKLGRYFDGWRIGIMTPNGGLWSIDRIGYLKAMNARGYHIFMKPGYEVRFFAFRRSVCPSAGGSERE